MRVLWELDHSLRRMSKLMQARLGVTGPQRLVIRLVGRLPGLAAGDLATLLHVDPSSLTGILHRLERGRVLARSPDRKDRRRALFSLTARGLAVDRVRSGTVEAAVMRVLEGQPRARVGSAGRVLAALARELDVERRR
jgi:DNA-binding MarR family transcriptional regulator